MGIYVHFDNNSHGPLDEQGLKELLADGSITLATLAWHETLGDWVTLMEVLNPDNSLATVANVPTKSPQAASANVEKGSSQSSTQAPEDFPAKVLEGPSDYQTGVAGKWRDFFVHAGRRVLKKAKLTALRLTLGERFSRAFRRVAAGGVLSDRGLAELRCIAEAAGVPWQQAMATCRPAARQLLVRAFNKALDDGGFTVENEQMVRHLATTCGLPWAEVLALAAPFTRIFVRHVLAEAVSSGRISTDDRQVIMGHLAKFGLVDMRGEVETTITRINMLYLLSRNMLPPPLAIQRDWLAAGEAVYLNFPAWRKKVSGRKQVVTVHPGEFFVTANRVEFLSETHGGSWRLTILREVEVLNFKTLAIMTSRGQEIFEVNEAAVASALTKCLMRLGNRLVGGGEMDSRGHRKIVSTDVRNAVWIRDRGRCVECGANDYLEFDHVIPVSRGGAATVANIQLLCRRCNGSKGAAL